MKVLVTGGCGYIGSHTVLALLDKGVTVVILDNLSNSSVESLRRVEKLTGEKTLFVNGDIRDKECLRRVFRQHEISSVIHFAALKAVAESVQKPLDYYHNNVYGTLCLLDVMSDFNVYDFIFSSSATVYGEESEVPYVESMKTGTPSSPYGASKLMVERMMQDLSKTHSRFRGISLRYFNPIGAHKSGCIGESPKGVPNNLLPYIAQVVVGKRDKLSVFGNDYSTEDGTCERDYLHVMDLAEGHVAALQWLNQTPEFSGVEVFNLGTAKAISVFTILNAFENICGKKIPYEIAPRRAGDLPAFWADASKAMHILNWQAKRSLDDMIEDTWRWQKLNPNGY